MDIFQITGLTFVSLFYLLYLGKQFLLRNKGIKSDRLGKGDKPKKTQRIERSLLIFTFSLPLIQYISILWNNKLLLTHEPSAYLKIVGAFIAVTGIVFFLLAIITMKDSWRAGVDAGQKTKMVTTGIYRYSRNPAFVGFDLFYIGICLMFPNILLIMMSIITILFFHFQIKEEENFLPAVFGEEYIQYSKKVRRYL